MTCDGGGYFFDGLTGRRPRAQVNANNQNALQLAEMGERRMCLGNSPPHAFSPRRAALLSACWDGIVAQFHGFAAQFHGIVP